MKYKTCNKHQAPPAYEVCEICALDVFYETRNKPKSEEKSTTDKLKPLNELVSRWRKGKLKSELVEEISRLQELNSKLMEWQPIETAPLDGTRVLLYEDDYMGIGAYSQWARDGEGRVLGFERNDLRESWQWDGSGFEANPSHWMPLPEPRRK